MKTCTKCGVEKLHKEFNVLRGGSNGEVRFCLRNYCRICENKQADIGREKLWKKHPEKLAKHKIVQKIGRIKRTPQKKQQDKLRYEKNKDEISKKAKKYREENYEYWRMKRYTAHYKISEEYYWELRKLENCQCCGDHKSKFKKGLFIDHDHITGKVRGLICQNCNAIAGFAKDNKDRLKLVSHYLDRTS
jgi:hypothetical protein